MVASVNDEVEMEDFDYSDQITVTNADPAAPGSNPVEEDSSSEDEIEINKLKPVPVAKSNVIKKLSNSSNASSHDSSSNHKQPLSFELPESLQDDLEQQETKAKKSSKHKKHKKSKKSSSSSSEKKDRDGKKLKDTKQKSEEQERDELEEFLNGTDPMPDETAYEAL